LSKRVPLIMVETGGTTLPLVYNYCTRTDS
jgi:hypothetical protein